MNILRRIRNAAVGGAKDADMQARMQRIEELAKLPLTNNAETRRVEILMLKFKEEPRVIDAAIHNIVHRTEHPFSLKIFDNRLNPPNTSKIWNALVDESSCEYIVIIDSDAFVPELSPCWLTRMMESIDETGIVVPLGDNISGGNKGDQMDPYPSASRYSQKKMGRGWTGHCFLFKKDVWRAHPFDERFYLYGQDSAWAYLQEKHGGAVLRSDVLVRHLHSYSANKAVAEGTLDRDADKQYARALMERIRTEAH